MSQCSHQIFELELEERLFRDKQVVQRCHLTVSLPQKPVRKFEFEWLTTTSGRRVCRVLGLLDPLLVNPFVVIKEVFYKPRQLACRGVLLIKGLEL